MERGSRRRITLLFAGLLVVATLLAGRLVLGGGGAGDDTAGASTPASLDGVLTGNRSAQEETDDTAAVPEVVLAAGDTFNVYASRNPFEPAVGGGFTGSDDDFTTPTTGDDPFDDDFTNDTTPTTQPGETATTAPGDTTPTSAPTFDPTRQTVTLLDVYDSNGTFRASVQVDATVFDVGPGETFAGRFRVVSLDDPCGQFLYGDSPFRLCEGEQVLK